MGIKKKLTGIMENKVSRRVALGSIAGGLAGAALITHALRARYKVNIPTSEMPGPAWTTTPGTIVREYQGEEIKIEIPQMEIKTREDMNKLAEIISEQFKKSPQYDKVLKKQFEQLATAPIDRNEKFELDRIASLPVKEDEQITLVNKTKETAQRCRDRVLDAVGKTTLPPTP